jgi:hypothetical protein
VRLDGYLEIFVMREGQIYTLIILPESRLHNFVKIIPISLAPP